MDQFIAKHADKLQGTLSCFDRVLFRGYLPFFRQFSEPVVHKCLPYQEHPVVVPQVMHAIRRFHGVSDVAKGAILHDC